MKIAILTPKNDFTQEQQVTLSKTGEVVFSSAMEQPIEEFIELSRDAVILAVDPDNFGGFETAKEKLDQLIETLPNLKGLALDTTSFGWVDLEYARTKGITVCNIPGYSRESVAEHTIALLLCLAKRIIELDRKTQQGKYKLEKGFELKGKTLGIIGLGSIGSRVAELGACLGMKVIAYNRSPKTYPKVEMVSLEELLKRSDAVSVHATHEDSNANFLDQEKITQMKDGVIIVNTDDREFIDEVALSEAMKSGKVFGYAYEGEDLDNTPLKGLDRAIGIKGFGWYTTEALVNLMQIWVDNIVALAHNKPQNIVKT